MKNAIVIMLENFDGAFLDKIMSVLHEENTSITQMNVEQSHSISFGRFEFSPLKQIVIRDGAEIHLTYGECAVLCKLIQNPKRIFTVEQLYQATWGDENYCNYRTVHNTIYRLRRKLEPDPHHPIYIKTVVGAGYKFDPPQEEHIKKEV